MNVNRIDFSEINQPNQRQGYHSIQVSGSIYEIEERYTLISPIGKGAYGIVISAQDEQTGSKVALKILRNISNNLVDGKRLLREISLLKHLHHSNILDIQDIGPPFDYHDLHDIYIVSTLMETDLHRVIYSGQVLTDDHIQYFLYQSLIGLYYLHSADIIHRDLKPSNLLVNGDCLLKICDFGMARNIDDDVNSVLTEYVVTRHYRAPEIMVACRQYNKAIDIWSLGCIFAELISRNPLFPGNNYMHQLQLMIDLLGTPSDEDLVFVTSENALRFLRSLPYKDPIDLRTLYPNSNPIALDLLKIMLTFNPNKRPTVKECLDHPYFDSIRDLNDYKTCDTPFIFPYEDIEFTQEMLSWFLYQEIRGFHTELPEVPRPVFNEMSN